MSEISHPDTMGTTATESASPSPELRAQYAEMRPQIVSLYSQAEEWHGTGRI